MSASPNRATQEPVAKKDRELTVRERQVILQYVTGEDGVAGNITQSYRKIFPCANYNTASVAGSELLKLPSAQRFLEELHREATSLATDRLVPWIELLPLAQAIIVATAQGRLRNRLAYEAAIYLTNRVLGGPVSSHDIHVRDDARITRAVTAFTRRVATEQRQLGDGDGQS